MNEPALFVPAAARRCRGDVVHPGGGEPRLHAQVHNLYGSLMAQATREGLARLRPDARPFVISRAGYAGLQRHALHWTGDNSSWWEHLWMSMPQLQNLGLSGLALGGVDVGGFFGDCDRRAARALDGVRRLPAVLPQPLGEGHASRRSRGRSASRTRAHLPRHAAAAHAAAAVPLHAVRGGATAPARRSCGRCCSSTPTTRTTYAADDEFLLGDALLVAPITRPGIEHRHVYLPRGTWVQWLDRRAVRRAGARARARAARPPGVYVRANAPIPLWPEREHTGGAPDALTLRVVRRPRGARRRARAVRGRGRGLRRVLAPRSVRCTVAGDTATVTLAAGEGSFVPARERVELELRGLPAPSAVEVDGRPHDAWRHEDGAVLVELAERPEATAYRRPLSGGTVPWVPWTPTISWRAGGRGGGGRPRRAQSPSRRADVARGAR